MPVSSGPRFCLLFLPQAHLPGKDGACQADLQMMDRFLQPPGWSAAGMSIRHRHRNVALTSPTPTSAHACAAARLQLRCGSQQEQPRHRALCWPERQANASGVQGGPCRQRSIPGAACSPLGSV